MSKHKDFEKLFGCDNSDEENLQTEFPASKVTEQMKNVSENAHHYDRKQLKHTFKDTYELMKPKEKQNKVNINNTKTPISSNDRLENFEGKRLKSISEEHNKKRIKSRHGEDKYEQKSNEVVLDSTETSNKISRPSNIIQRQNGDDDKKEKLKKIEIGKLVVKLLTPAYVEKRFESRDTFKTLARNISHALYDKGKTNVFFNCI